LKQEIIMALKVSRVLALRKLKLSQIINEVVLPQLVFLNFWLQLRILGVKSKIIREIDFIGQKLKLFTLNRPGHSPAPC
jgi:hypothetical protein